MKLNEIQTHFYSTRELDQVMGTLDALPWELMRYDESMRKVINQVQRKRVQFSTQAIQEIGRELGLTNAAAAVIKALEQNRDKKKSTTVANDDDVLTVGQLREAIKEVTRGFAQGRWVTEGSADDFTDQVMERVNHPWFEGNVVKDATGNYYKRTQSGGWMSFGNSGYHPDSTPVRPLKKIN